LLTRRRFVVEEDVISPSVLSTMRSGMMPLSLASL
jgi:hypothetical protein